MIIIGLIAVSAIFLGGDNLGILEDPNLIVRKEILAGSTFSIIASEAGVATSTAGFILETAKKVYDLSLVRAGKELVFVFDKNTNELKELNYDIDTEERLIVKNISTTTEDWLVERKQIEYETEITTFDGVIDTSLYETIVNNGGDERLAIALAEVFAWQIDFAGEIQKGDSFEVLYEKRYSDGIYTMPGKVLAARFIASGQEYKGFYFKGGDGKDGYYDESGKSLEKVFLKSPIQYRYISSGFSYRRVNPVTGDIHAHRAIDYVAPSGTPVVTIGDGTVVRAGWNGAYGISVKVRHNDTYSTVYGHFSSLAKGIKRGAIVKQGQVIGYVGSTGQSTGPHLHYEVHKFGSLINPLTLVAPDGKPVSENDKIAFEEIKKQYNF